MDASLKKKLEIQACKVRLGIIEGVYNAKSGHPGGSLSIADTLTYLYFAKMNVYPEKPDEPTRDRFVLSKGHTAPALYSTLAHRGFFSVEELKSLRHIGALLQGHPCINIPGVDMSSGSLGQGISVACGMALSAKISNDTYKVYTILGDGEIQEGQVWEAAMFAAHYKLDNLVAVVDNNGLQIDGNIKDVMSPYPIVDKFKAFGWHVIEMDAHDFDAIEKAFDEAGKKSPLKFCRFEDFRLDYYPTEINGEYGCSSRERMEGILAFCKGYADDFDRSSQSILMLGETGLGKTHLSLSIAGEVISRGYNAVYNSAQNIFTELNKEHFGRSDISFSYEAMILDCDLLVIDDLGAEFATQFTNAALYNIINTRINYSLPTIINTNLSLKELEEKYTRRISSRIIGEYAVLDFFGYDIRQIKNEQ